MATWERRPAQDIGAPGTTGRVRVDGHVRTVRTIDRWVAHDGTPVVVVWLNRRLEDWRRWLVFHLDEQVEQEVVTAAAQDTEVSE